MGKERKVFLAITPELVVENCGWEAAILSDGTVLSEGRKVGVRKREDNRLEFQPVIDIIVEATTRYGTYCTVWPANDA